MVLLVRMHTLTVDETSPFMKVTLSNMYDRRRGLLNGIDLKHYDFWYRRGINGVGDMIYNYFFKKARGSNVFKKDKQLMDNDKARRPVIHMFLDIATR